MELLLPKRRHHLMLLELFLVSLSQGLYQILKKIILMKKKEEFFEKN
jgi:hypothetical protein